MNRDIFKALSVFDWITPIIGIVQDIVNDSTLFQSRSWTFFIDYEMALNAGWSPRQIEKYLRKKGVKTWGSQYTFLQDRFFFSVDLDNADYAHYLLEQQRIPVLYAPTEAVE